MSNFEPGNFNGNGESVSSSQSLEISEAIGIARNEQQIRVVTDYYNTHFNGRIFWKEVVNVLKNNHNPGSFFMSAVENADTDKDGFISASEFVQLSPCVEEQLICGPIFLDLLTNTKVNKNHSKFQNRVVQKFPLQVSMHFHWPN